jgi:pimeloyl-ACP methyl ester carboxylesterase
VGIGSVVRGVVHRDFQVEGEDDRVERWLMLCERHRDGKPPSIRFPPQLEERAARPLDVEQLLNEPRVCTLIEIDHDAPAGAVDQARTLANPAVALILCAETGIVKSTAWGHRKRIHSDRLTRPDECLAALLEELVRAWPVDVRQIALVGHSMGGLVARSAAYQADQHDHEWGGRVGHIVSLGTDPWIAAVARG